jgi:hypothetical protein
MLLAGGHGNTARIAQSAARQPSLTTHNALVRCVSVASATATATASTAATTTMTTHAMRTLRAYGTHARTHATALATNKVTASASERQWPARAQHAAEPNTNM